jgi:DNA mismatch repair protein MutS2
MNPHALQVLELPEALEQVARLAGSALGAQAVRNLRPMPEVEPARAELDRAWEMVSLLRSDPGWGVGAAPDLHEPLLRLRVEGTLWEGALLRDAGALLASARNTRRAVLGRADEFPGLGSVAELLVELPEIEAAIGRAIDEHGAVVDDASPVLRGLRREIHGIRSRIVDRLAAYAASLPHHFQVPDASVTVREGRYVIPVRREGRGEVGGIVHGESASGATLFVEPPLAIELMNRLREREADEAREVLRILRELTERLRPHRKGLVVSLEALVVMDSLVARARYAVRVEGHRPELLPAGAGGYRVVLGRHPLLVARDEPVVPFDLAMDDEERTLLISGPNTGGKTVLLKAVGLISLLAQSGVVPPVGAGTRLPVFRDVFADIGDEQSIEASLSTFSAHLRNLRETLESAGWDSLVLIDEMGSGTDPREGAALARAVLVELTRRSAFTVATTHLGELKLLAGEEGGIVNASLHFDAERLQPTYRLLKGLPGRSYGLAIARRLGFPHELLDEAESYLPEGERDVARLLLDLEAREQEVSRLQGELSARLAEADSLWERLAQGESELRQREKDAERRSRQQARDHLLQARQEVEEAIREVRSAADAAVLDATALDQAARAGRRRVEEAARKHRDRAPAERHPRIGEETAAATRLEVGLRVRIGSLGRTGTVIELRDARVMVEAGGVRLLLPTSDLEPLPRGDQEARTAERRTGTGGGYLKADMEAAIEVDLRGLRVDELEMKLGRALDAALVSGLPTFRIIHGKGTGALRDRVEALVRADPRVARHRPGERHEGGTGVTVVEFR